MALSLSFLPLRHPLASHPRALARALSQLTLALEHVHSLNVIFRDLKPENVMVGMDGHLKLTDFGMSKRLDLAASLDRTAAGGSRKAGTICGTPEYIAPEVLQGKLYDSTIDWWTLGCLVYAHSPLVIALAFALATATPLGPLLARCIAGCMQQHPLRFRSFIPPHPALPSATQSRSSPLPQPFCPPPRRRSYEMLLGRPPFRSADMGMLVQQIIKGRLQIPKHVSPQATSIIRGLLAGKADERLGRLPEGASMVKASPFFADLDWARLLAKEVDAPCVPTDRTAASSGGSTSAEARGRHGEGHDLLSREFTSWAAPLTAAAAAAAPNTLPRAGSSAAMLAQGATPRGALSATLGPRSVSCNGLLSLAAEEPEDANQRLLQLEVGADASVCAVSAALIRLLGYVRPQRDVQQLLGRCLLTRKTTLLHPEDVPRFAAAFSEAAARYDVYVAALAASAAALGEDEAESYPASAEYAASLDVEPTPAFEVEMDADALGQHEPPTPPTPVEITVRFQRSKEAVAEAAATRAASGGNSSGESFKLQKAGSESFRQRREYVFLQCSIERSAASLAAALADAARPAFPSADGAATPGAAGGSNSSSSVAASPESGGSSGMGGEVTYLISVKDVTTEEEYKSLVRRRYEWSYNVKMPDESVAALFTASMNFNHNGTQLPMTAGSSKRTGVESYLDRRRLLTRAFPDLHFRLLEQTCQADGQVYTSWQWLGTHLGPYHAKTYDGTYVDIAPSGTRVRCCGVAVDMCVTEDGKKLINDHAAYFDEASLRMQLMLPDERSHGRMGIRARAAARTSAAKTLRLSSEIGSGVRVQLYLTVHPPLYAAGLHDDDDDDDEHDEDGSGHERAERSSNTQGGAAVVRAALVAKPESVAAEGGAASALHAPDSAFLAMEKYYCTKALQQLAYFGGDGFCILSADPRPQSVGPQRARGSASTSSTTPAKLAGGVLAAAGLLSPAAGVLALAEG